MPTPISSHILLQDIPKLIEGVEQLAQRLGIHLSKYVWWIVAAALLVWLVTWVVKLVNENYVKPLRATPEERRRRARRQMFAGVIEGKIRDINSNEEWRDYRFTELEAEVEAEGARRTFSILPFRHRTQSGLRRERSLTRAIEMSRERLVQLEGEPGSGKSVALRFVTRALAERAAKSRSLKSVIPLYLNLKELSRAPNEHVNQALIRSFVFRSLNKANDRDVEQFLEEEFANGLQDGTWLFLFDSFDEIPEVLSSTEADEVIRDYAGAISDFLGGMNRCRGVVASRHFRGPGQSRWPRFRILPLSGSRRLKLIKRALLPPDVEEQLIGHLAMAGHELRDMSGNPMLLGLLAEYMKGDRPFPDNIHTILSYYLEYRLVRDEVRVRHRYGVGAKEVRAAAESAAFCMAADVNLGLSPVRSELKNAMARHGFELGAEADTLLDALAFIKLARSEEWVASGDKLFTFAHRRFQEYFATCVVLREPGLVSPRVLLSDARWRETAAVMCQSQPAAVLGPLVEEMRVSIATFSAGFGADQQDESEDKDEELDNSGPIKSVAWPKGLLHLLSLLQDGFSRRLDGLPGDIRERVGRMLLAVNRKAGRYDHKCMLEVAGSVPTSALLKLLRTAFKSDSQLLRNIAYRQVARLGEIPDDIADAIRGALLRLAVTGRLARERRATQAHLARLHRPERFTSSMRLLLMLPHVDLLLHALAFLGVLMLLTLIAAARPRGLNSTVWIVFSVVPFLALLASHVSLRLVRPLRSIAGQRFYRVVIAALRLPPLIFLYGFFSVAERQGVTPVWAGLYTVVCWYLVLWPPSAMIAAQAGRYTSVIWWPLMPAVPLLLVIRNYRKILAACRKNWKSLTLFLPITAATMILFPRALQRNPSLASILTIAILPFVIPPTLYAAFIWLRDKVRWHARSRTYVSPMNARTFIAEFNGYKSSLRCVKFVNLVRSRELLEATKEADEAIEALALALEGGGVGRKQHTIVLFFKQFERLMINSSEQVSEVIDELTLLLEQVRAARRDHAPQQQQQAERLRHAPSVDGVTV